MNASTSQGDLENTWNIALANRVEQVRESNPDSPPEQWRSAGRKTKDKPHGEDLQWWAGEGLRQLESYKAWLEATDWEFVEFNGNPLIEFNLSGNIGEHYVKGFLDAVMTDGEKTMLVDYKTGSRTPFGVMQLGVYRVMLRNLTGVDATHGVFWMTRKAEPGEPVSLDRYTDEYVGRIFNQFNAAVENQIFLPREGSHCWSCDVRSACYVQGGTDSYKFDPDHPKYLHKQEPTQ